MRRATLILFLFLTLAPSVFAHEVRPAYLELRQNGSETYDALWKVPGQGEDLRLVALKEDDLDGEVRFLVKVAAHALPNRNHFWIVGNGSQPDCFSHRPPQSLIPNVSKEVPNPHPTKIA